MDMHPSLFVGQRIRLAQIDRQVDAEIESRWSHDPEYMRLMYLDPVRPLSKAQLVKKYEAQEKSADEAKNLYLFTLRTLSDDRLVGVARIAHIEWSIGNASLRLGIGEPRDRRQGYGREALGLLLRYAFNELNLYRVSASLPEYNQPALRLFTEAGFVEEVRQRQAVHRDGRRWDLLRLGLLREEWQA